MGKTQEEKMNERLQEIDRLKREIEERKEKLLKLIGLVDEKPDHDPTPPGFALGDAILAILKKKGQDMRIMAVVEAVKKEHGFRPDRKVVQSSLNHIVSKGLAEKVEGKRGLYRAKP